MKNLINNFNPLLTEIGKEDVDIKLKALRYVINSLFYIHVSLVLIYFLLFAYLNSAIFILNKSASSNEIRNYEPYSTNAVWMLVSTIGVTYLYQKVRKSRKEYKKHSKLEIANN